MKIKVHNFQSIVDAEVIVDGFTGITGPSNIGKSALIRAIKAFVDNETGDWFVNNKCKDSTYVEVEKNGRTIRWERKKKKTFYVIDGEVIENLKGKVPPEVEELGLSSLVLSDNTKQWVNITPSQFETLFLMKESEGTIAANILSSLSKTKEVENASRECAKELRSLKTLRTVRNSDCTQESQKLEIFENLYNYF